MRPGICQIAPHLWQAAMAHASTSTITWETVVYMALPGEPPPQCRHWILWPIDDDPSGCLQFADVRELARFLKERDVLSVCHMGENRSGLLSALILVERGHTPTAAVQLVQTLGPHNSPTQPHSFWNPGFVRQVLELDKP